ncbi:hypothetical protein LZ31DRAFT_550077 [Colletotrichum somersetense]|nr:hypothetical protein LZ31DRAFT_550077 [Colletotrichum somersetense]
MNYLSTYLPSKQPSFFLPAIPLAFSVPCPALPAARPPTLLPIISPLIESVVYIVCIVYIPDKLANPQLNDTPISTRSSRQVLQGKVR